MMAVRRVWGRGGANFGLNIRLRPGFELHGREGMDGFEARVVPAHAVYGLIVRQHGEMISKLEKSFMSF